MTLRRPIRAAQALNAAADIPAGEPATEGVRTNRDLIEEIRQALIAARLYGPIILEYSRGYSKLVCPRKNEESLPRTLVIVNSDMTLTVRHPHDCAGDTVRRPLTFAPEDYVGKDIGQFAIDGIWKLHGINPRPHSAYQRGLSI
jgi:hypothetical protein